MCCQHQPTYDEIDADGKRDRGARLGAACDPEEGSTEGVDAHEHHARAEQHVTERDVVRTIREVRVDSDVFLQVEADAYERNGAQRQEDVENDQSERQPSMLR